MGGLKERWEEVQSRVQAACKSVGRHPAEVTVIAVTKTVALDQILEAYGIGLRHFGESRLQEAVPKVQSLPDDVTWHFVGKLQSNKARKVAELFDVVHTLESENQLREMDKTDLQVQGLVEVNLGREPQKAGVFAEDLDTMVQRLSCSQHVRYRGLMTIGPLEPDPEQSRKVFRSLAQLGKRAGAEWLSMGMSADYDVAIQEGATHVRVGSALFGERK